MEHMIKAVSAKNQTAIKNIVNALILEFSAHLVAIVVIAIIWGQGQKLILLKITRAKIA